MAAELATVRESVDEVRGQGRGEGAVDVRADIRVGVRGGGGRVRAILLLPRGGGGLLRFVPRPGSLLLGGFLLGGRCDGTDGAVKGGERLKRRERRRRRGFLLSRLLGLFTLLGFLCVVRVPASRLLLLLLSPTVFPGIRVGIRLGRRPRHRLALLVAIRERTLRFEPTQKSAARHRGRRQRRLVTRVVVAAAAANLAEVRLSLGLRRLPHLRVLHLRVPRQRPRLVQRLVQLGREQVLHDEVLRPPVQAEGFVELDVRHPHARLGELPVHHRAVRVHHVPAPRLALASQTPLLPRRARRLVARRIPGFDRVRGYVAPAGVRRSRQLDARDVGAGDARAAHEPDETGHREGRRVARVRAGRKSLRVRRTGTGTGRASVDGAELGGVSFQRKVQRSRGLVVPRLLLLAHEVRDVQTQVVGGFKLYRGGRSVVVAFIVGQNRSIAFESTDERAAVFERVRA
mmetsp:Transcript_13079/g.59039  ORF Transcript_13079/g.59039 Transcript_13079/m.59039 type:complete len:459 (-) Transcript_13079:828-2204(-)